MIFASLREPDRRGGVTCNKCMPSRQIQNLEKHGEKAPSSVLSALPTPHLELVALQFLTVVFHLPFHPVNPWQCFPAQRPQEKGWPATDTLTRGLEQLQSHVGDFSPWGPRRGQGPGDQARPSLLRAGAPSGGQLKSSAAVNSTSMPRLKRSHLIPAPLLWELLS